MNRLKTVVILSAAIAACGDKPGDSGSDSATTSGSAPGGTPGGTYYTIPTGSTAGGTTGTGVEWGPLTITNLAPSVGGAEVGQICRSTPVMGQVSYYGDASAIGCSGGTDMLTFYWLSDGQSFASVDGTTVVFASVSTGTIEPGGAGERVDVTTNKPATVELSVTDGLFDSKLVVEFTILDDGKERSIDVARLVSSNS